MAKVLDMPKLSPTMEEGVLTAWHKKEGDAIEIDDLLAEVETDKATMEFRSFDKGTLLKLLVPAGAQVKLGQAVAVLGQAGEDVSSLVGASAAPASGAKVQAPAASAARPARPVEEIDVGAQTEAPAARRPEALANMPGPETEVDDDDNGPITTASRPRALLKRRGSPLDRTEREPERVPGISMPAGGRVLASPYVRKAARERGIDLRGTKGTGPGGRVVARDLEGLRAAPTPANDGREGVIPQAEGATALARMPQTMPVPLEGPGEPRLAAPEARPLSMMRKTIARRLTESKQTVPHFYLTIDVDAERLVQLREAINRELAASAPTSSEPAEKPLKVSLNDLLIKACAVALTHVPECNAQFSPEAILLHKRVDISVAVAVPDGLVTPVVRNADLKSVVAIAKEVRDLASRARAKKLKPEEMLNGTFSISNLGMFGIDAFSAVINPPEGAILAVGQVREEPVVSDGMVRPGKRLSMTLSCDHRVIDGAIGASFLAELRSLLEHPMRVLTG